MNLAQILHQALTNPSFRLALETGTVQSTTVQLPASQVEAVLAVLRGASRQGKGILTQVFEDKNWNE